jgi:hypothetical protein
MATKIVTKNSSTASAVPTASDLVQGELAVNVADKRLFTEDNAGAIVELGTNPSSLTVSGNIDVDGVTNLDAVDIDGAVDMASTLQVDGAATFTTEITANGGIALGDNDKATFGDAVGGDLQIYHDGSNSIIEDTSTGNLQLITNGNAIALKSSDGDAMVSAIKDGDVKLYFNNNQKLATTSTGIDVTGTATMDGLVVDGTSVLDSETNFVANSTASNKSLVLASSGATGGNGQYGASVAFSRINSESPRAAIAAVNTDSNYERMGLSFWTHPNNTADVMVKRMQIDHDGDISFYEDTGTTAKLFWDASAESLGIGTSSPDTQLTLYKASTNADVDYAKIRMDSWGGSTGKLKSIVWDDAGSSVAGIGAEYDGGKTNIHFHSQYNGGFKGTADRTMSIMGNGNVGIGTSSPSGKTHSVAADAQVAVMAGGDISDPLYPAFGFDGQIGSNGGRGAGMYLPSDGTLAWSTAGAERARIDSSGNVGIGVTPNTSSRLHVGKSGGSPELWLERTDGYVPVKLIGNTLANGQGFKINVNNGDRLAIDSSGNVGIGTSSPSAPLHVSGSDSTVPIKIDNTGTGGDTWRIWSTNDAASDGGGKLGFYNEDTATRAMTLDSSGNVGIGTSSPSSLLHLSSSAPTLQFSETDVGVQNYIQASGGGFNFFADDTNAASGTKMGFFIDGAERMRIDSSGRLLVGTSSQIADAKLQIQIADIGAAIKALNNGNWALGFYNSSGSNVGNVVINASSTSYNTSSDQRLKENIADADDAGSKIDAIQVRKYDWKADGSHQDYGMIAQELQAVAPEAVSGDADSEDMMGVDYSKLVPMLIKEIQSLRNRVAQLEE